MKAPFMDEALKQDELANKMVLLLNGNTVEFNLKVIRLLTHKLEEHSFLNISSDMLKKNRDCLIKSLENF
jgi:hypothetical protein